MKGLEVGFVKFRNQLNRLFPHNKNHYYSSAIITAAGSGQRMGGVSKQLLNLCGKPCILYSLSAFQNCKEIDEIIVVAKESEIQVIESICKENNITKLKGVVPGGSTRQESVANGYFAISKGSDLVAIHDAARPMILPEHIEFLLKNAKRYGASCAAKKVTDTVKRADKSEFITQTISRDNLYTVQTPQVFLSDLYRVSLAVAKKTGVAVTDDCALAENAGFSIKLCDLGIYNLKLTTKDDVTFVESYLREREHA